MMQLHPDFRDLLSCFNSASVRYLLVGGYAVNFHGHHRNTKDLDLWIAISPDNADAVSRALHAFGFSVVGAPPDLFLKERQVYTFGREPMRVDILTSPSGVEFDACYERRTEAVIAGIKVPIISLKDLLINKQASGRPRDVDDVAQLDGSATPVAPSKRRRRKRGPNGERPEGT
jgi:predicted nucleotidyltransferase